MFSAFKKKHFHQKESPEGGKMLDFRKSLPAFKEKERLLQAIAKNQVRMELAASFPAYIVLYFLNNKQNSSFNRTYKNTVVR